MENASLCKSQILGANLRGCSDWSEAPAAELVNQPEPQLTLISFQGHREGAEFLPKPGITAQNLDTTEQHLQSLGSPRLPSAATSEGRGH